ncbi:hypothetical protein ACNPLN_06750 [Klebsiella pneumoniae]
MNNEISVKDLISSIKKKGLLQSIPQLEQIYQFAIEVEKKLAESEAKFVQLAAENVALKAVFSQEEIPSEAVDAFMETAEMDHDWNETSEWSWVENETEVIHAVLDALKPETPATDRIVAEAEARGVEKGIAHLEKKFSNIGVQIMNLQWLADSLREGADK